MSKRDSETCSIRSIANNPIDVQVLGICSALAVTTKLDHGHHHGVARDGRDGVSNAAISADPQPHPEQHPHDRPDDDHRVAGDRGRPVPARPTPTTSASSFRVFVGLIITNCIVMGRAEAFAMKNPRLAELPGRPRQRTGLQPGADDRRRRPRTVRLRHAARATPSCRSHRGRLVPAQRPDAAARRARSSCIGLI